MTNDEELKARIALLEHYTSQMQGYKVNLLTIVVGFFAYVELIGRLSQFYFAFLLPLGVGALVGLGFWSVARMLWFGKHVRDIIREPKENPLNKLDEQVHKRWEVKPEVYDPDSFVGSIIKIGGSGGRLFACAIAIGFAVAFVMFVLELWFRCGHCIWG